jgi:hypothetical protein
MVNDLRFAALVDFKQRFEEVGPSAKVQFRPHLA